MTKSEPTGIPARWILGLGLAAMLVPLNSTMIAVALPDIADDLDIAKGTTGLLITVYLVVMLVGQPIAGRAADIFGTRRLIAVALVGFGLCSAAASFADSFWLVVLGRSAQAVFGSALIPASRAMLRLITAQDRRGRSFGLQDSLIGAGAAAGPLIGGIVTELVGWPGVFLVNIPISAAALVILRDLPAGSVSPDSVPAPVDTTQAELVPTVTTKRGTERPGMRGVLANRWFGVPFVTQASATLAQYSLLLAIPAVLDARGWNSTSIGGALILLTLGMVVMGPVGGQIGDTHGRRLPVLVGTALGALGVGLAAAFVEDSPAMLLVAMGAFGFGFGLVVPNLTTLALESVPDELAGSASGMWSMSRYVGSIPASLLFAAIVGDDIGDSRLLLLIATAAMLVAFSAASRLPNQHPLLSP